MAKNLGWCGLPSSGLLCFEGTDALTFLQGQLTNDVLALNASRAQITGYCTPKGRLLACALIWLREGAVFMMLPRDLCEPVRKRLSMYILRAKVKARDVSEDYVLYGVTDAASPALDKLGCVTPAGEHAVCHGDDVSVITLTLNRKLVIAAKNAAPRVEALLTAQATPSPEGAWVRAQIAAGIPSVVAATQEQFVPQSVNFDLIGAVSFSKGCYPGQEIVARTHYLGKPKQRMLRASLTSAVPPQPGDRLYSASFGDQASGMVVAVASGGDGAHELLAVVQRADWNATDIHWNTPDGAVLQRAPLPYDVP